jgi:hypothetical protein
VKDLGCEHCKSVTATCNYHRCLDNHKLTSQNEVQLLLASHLIRLHSLKSSEVILMLTILLVNKEGRHKGRSFNNYEAE